MYNFKVFIIVLNWNGKEDTLECLDSVQKIDYPNFEVVVVDNGSSDDSVKVIPKESPLFRYFITRNKLLWAEKNLPFFERLVVYKNAAKEHWTLILPPKFRLIMSGDISLTKRIYSRG